jgi:hypothetical protein
MYVGARVGCWLRNGERGAVSWHPTATCLEAERRTRRARVPSRQIDPVQPSPLSEVVFLFLVGVTTSALGSDGAASVLTRPSPAMARSRKPALVLDIDEASGLSVSEQIRNALTEQV